MSSAAMAPDPSKAPSTFQYSPKFLSALAFTLKEEGQYTPGLKGDTGGETYRGISRKNNPQWAGWEFIDKAKSAPKWASMSRQEQNQELAAISQLQDLVVLCYWTKYWVPNYERLNNQSVCTFAFDMGVNEGIRESTLLFQRGVNACNIDPPIAEDGEFGGQTVSAANQIFPEDLMQKLKDTYSQFYKNLALKSPADKVFLSDWLNRVNAHCS